MAGARNGSGRQELQRRDMPRSNDGEVATIEGRDLRLAKPFAQGNHGSVDETEIQVRVLFLKLSRAEEIILDGVFEPVRARNDVFDERQPCAWREIPLHPVVNFNQRCRRNDERFAGVADQVNAPLMVLIARVEQCHNRACVED